jgi:hypothetical protein
LDSIPEIYHSVTSTAALCALPRKTLFHVKPVSDIDREHDAKYKGSCQNVMFCEKQECVHQNNGENPAYNKQTTSQFGQNGRKYMLRPLLAEPDGRERQKALSRSWVKFGSLL